MSLDQYLQHDIECILAQWSQGEPTPEGGYRTMYAGKWYQSKPVDETPKCTCGLDREYERRGTMYYKLAVAIMRFRDDPTNDKRLTTIDNLIEELKSFNQSRG